MDEFEPIPGFMGYSVSNLGQIRNDNTGRLMAITLNSHGIAQVGLMRAGIQNKRGVARLVANAFLDPPYPKTFDTPIHLDGDPLNNRIDNLMWRPRWFAQKYSRQFARYEDVGPYINKPIRDIKSRRRFKTSWEAATELGLLDMEIALAVFNHTYVWPTYQQFEVIQE